MGGGGHEGGSERVMVSTGLAILVCVCAVAAVCAAEPESSAFLKAGRWTEGGALDGRVVKDTWRKTETVELILPGDAQTAGPTPLEAGRARMAWDDEHLYVALEFDDSYITNSSTADDQKHHFNGDVGEIFLKPSDRPWYWELHVTPNGWISAMYWPGPGSMRPPGYDPLVKPRFFQAVVSAGDTNVRGWTAEMAIPWRALYREQPFVAPVEEKWTVLVARYNYDRTGRAELSSWPGLPKTSFHLTDFYACLHLTE
jgi:hypothetical protein